MRRTEKIASRQNSIIKKIADLKKNPTASSFIMEGVKFVCDVPRDCITELFTTHPEKYESLIDELLKRDVPVYEITEPVMDKLSDTVSGQELVAVVSATEHTLPEKLVILDGVRDSGNAGTIIRTACAFGYGCIFSEDSANPYSVKTVRSTAGAVTNCYIERCRLSARIKELRADGYRIFSSELDETAMTPSQADISGKFAVIIGNEGRGVGKDISALSDNSVYIPISGTESLNAAVAAGILMYALKSER